MKAEPQKGRKAYMHAYHQRPEVKERKRAYYQRPEVKERERIRARVRYHVQYAIPDAMLSPRVKRLLALAEGWT